MTITYSELSRAGRLGNQLWEIASTIGIAEDQGDRPRFPVWDYSQFFSLPDEWFIGIPGPRGMEVINPRPATDFATHLDPGARGYLQDFNLFARHEDKIREYFEPSPAALTILEEEWDKHFADLPEPLISIHVRRGDNVTHPQGYHPLRSMDYYKRGLELRPEGTVVCFSDDPEWCKANIEAGTGRDVAVFYEGVARPREYEDRVLYENAPVLDWIDIQLMSACDHHIISNSTYAWWGAYLSEDPEPIFPSNWFGWRVRDWTNSSLMFPSTWREIHDDTEGGI